MLDKDSVGKLHSHLSVATAIMLTNERIYFKEEGRRRERKREKKIKAFGEDSQIGLTQYDAVVSIGHGIKLK